MTMANPADKQSDPRSLLREDLNKEYYALLDQVSKYDTSLLVVKGWSVTLSLAGLGLGFKEQHYALFALAALSGVGFWLLDGLMKGHQYRYYVRMREIEYTAYLINRVQLGGEYGEAEISAPRIDMMWGFKGFAVKAGVVQPVRRRFGGVPHTPADWRADPPERRTPDEIHTDLRYRFLWPNVALPHLAAIVIGSVLSLAAVADLGSLGTIPL